MSILINGMSKKDFEEVIKYARYGANNCMIGERAEVVELPPHGRLIDADVLMKKGMPLSFSVQKWVQEVDIACARTIIEAEGEE